MKVKFVSDKGGILLRLLFIAAFFSLHAYLYFGSPLYKGEEAGKAAYSGDGFKLNLTGAVISRAQGDKIKIKAFALHPEIKIIVPENIPQRQIFFEIDNIGSHRAPLSSFLKNFKKLKNGVSFSLDVHVQGEFTVALPRDDSAKFNFAVMGDSRGSASPFANHRGAFFVFRRIITQAARTNPLFAIDLGDLVNSGKYYQYRILNCALRSMKNMVFLGVVGNHDLKNSGRRFWNILFGPPYYSFEHNGWRFIAVDNNAEDFGEEQFQWLEAELTRSSPGRFFVFMHKPLFDPRPGQNYTMLNDLQRERFIKLLANFRPAAVFASHIHGYIHEKKDGIDYFVTGGAGARLRMENAFYHYINVEIENGSVKYSTVKVSNLPDFRWLAYFSVNALILAGVFILL